MLGKICVSYIMVDIFSHCWFIGRQCIYTCVKNSSLGDGISIGDESGAIGLRLLRGGLRLPGPISVGGFKKLLKKQLEFS